MRKDIIVNEVFTDLLKPYNRLDYFTTDPIGPNHNFNQVRNYIDDSKNPMELGSNVANNNTPFKNTKEHREYYRAIKDGGFGDHYADIYYSVAHKEMERVQAAELKKANELMDRLNAEAKFGEVVVDLVEKVELKHKHENALFHFHDKVVRNIAPDENEYNALEKTLIDYKSFDNPNYKHELEKREHELTFNERLADIPQQTNSYNSKLEDNKYQWKVEQLESEVLSKYEEELRTTYPNKKASVQEKIDMFNTNPEFKKTVMEPIFDSVQDADFQLQRKLNNPEVVNMETPIQPLQVIPEQPINTKYADTDGVKIDKEIYKEALEVSAEISDLFNSMVKEQSQAPTNELKQPEVIEPTPLPSENIAQPGIGQKQPAITSTSDNNPLEDYNPFDQVHIDQWNRDLAAEQKNILKSSEFEQFRAVLSTSAIERYQPTQFGPSYTQDEGNKLDMTDKHVAEYWNQQTPEVKTSIFNQEQRLKEGGIEFQSVIPEANNTVMTEEYYSKHPEKKVVVEQIEAIRNKAKEEIKPENKETVQVDETEVINESKQTARAKMHGMRMQYT